MMTGTEIFCKAHEIARKTRAAFVTYRAAFSTEYGTRALNDTLRESLRV